MNGISVMWFYNSLEDSSSVAIFSIAGKLLWLEVVVVWWVLSPNSFLMQTDSKSSGILHFGSIFSVLTCKINKGSRSIQDTKKL